jgi:hypothetical protein
MTCCLEHQKTLRVLVQYLMNEEVAGKIKVESFFFFFYLTHFKLFLPENTNKNLMSQYFIQNTLKLIKKHKI